MCKQGPRGMAVTYRPRKWMVPYKTRLTGRLISFDNEGFGVTRRTPRHFAMMPEAAPTHTNSLMVRSVPGSALALAGTRLEPSGTPGFARKLMSNANLPRAGFFARRLEGWNRNVPDGSRRASGSARALPYVLLTMREWGVSPLRTMLLRVKPYWAQALWMRVRRETIPAPSW